MRVGQLKFWCNIQVFFSGILAWVTCLAPRHWRCVWGRLSWWSWNVGEHCRWQRTASRSRNIPHLFISNRFIEKNIKYNHIAGRGQWYMCYCRTNNMVAVSTRILQTSEVWLWHLDAGVIHWWLQWAPQRIWCFFFSSHPQQPHTAPTFQQKHRLRIFGMRLYSWWFTHIPLFQSHV